MQPRQEQPTASSWEQVEERVPVDRSSHVLSFRQPPGQSFNLSHGTVVRDQ